MEETKEEPKDSIGNVKGIIKGIVYALIKHYLNPSSGEKYLNNFHEIFEKSPINKDELSNFLITLSCSACVKIDNFLPDLYQAGQNVDDQYQTPIQCICVFEAATSLLNHVEETKISQYDKIFQKIGELEKLTALTAHTAKELTDVRKVAEEYNNDKLKTLVSESKRADKCYDISCEDLIYTVDHLNRNTKK